jgi:hypothetical protein
VGVAAGNKLTFWETERGNKIAQAASKDRRFSFFAFSPDSRRVVALAANAAQICNVADGEWSVFSLEESSNITAAEFTPDARAIITASENGSMRSWDTITGSAIGQPWHFSASPSALAVSPDASAIGFVSAHQLSLVDLRSYQRIMPSSPHRRAICSSELSVDARLVLTAGFDGAVWLTEVFSGSTNAPLVEPALSREDLVASARLLSGRELNDDEQLVEVETEKLLADWRRLRTNVTFAATPATQWHAARAARLFGDALWFGVRFHVERLAKLGAVDARLREWEAKAAAELARSERPEQQPAPILPRSPGAPANLIDLGGFYNASLAETWLPTNYAGRGNDLSQLPIGLQKFNGVPFDVRGVVQLSGSALENLGGKFPKQVTGIAIDRGATNVHFLQGAAWDALYGTVIGKYVIHYANGEKREAKIVFGKNVRDWWFPPTQPQITMEAAVAWQGYNSASRDVGMAVRIYQYRWTNPLPNEKIARIDFVSAMEKPAPFLLAVTTEPAD